MTGPPPAPGSARRRRALRLWENQEGLCWVCGKQMLRPDLKSLSKSPGRWTCTIDHIGKKNGVPRPIKGAHAGCNSARGHKTLEEIASHIKGVHTKFENESWVNGVFGSGFK